MDMDKEQYFNQIKEAIVLGVEDTALSLTRQGLEAGLEPMEIIREGFIPGLNVIGQEFEEGFSFLPELVVAGRIMKSAMEILEREMRKRATPHASVGRVVLGTVAGDIHTIGKDLVGTMLNLNGFEVYDLGCNVPTEIFVQKVKEMEPEILGISALLTTTMPVQEEIVKALIAAGVREQVKVIIGGASVHRGWAERIGADAYAETAHEAVTVCKDLLT